LLSAQVLALTLIPLLSGIVPAEGAPGANIPHLLGAVTPVTKDFMVGTWKYTDHFLRWGITDKKKASVLRVESNAFMSLREDGTVKMVNLFWPSEGRWDICEQGIIIHDPNRPDRGSQLIPVRKRDDNRIWLLLPYSGGANGIGMVKVTEDEQGVAAKKSKPRRRSASGVDLDPSQYPSLNPPAWPSSTESP
jgi:hypothetical protein